MIGSLGASASAPFHQWGLVKPGLNILNRITHHRWVASRSACC